MAKYNCKKTKAYEAKKLGYYEYKLNGPPPMVSVKPKHIPDGANDVGGMTTFEIREKYVFSRRGAQKVAKQGYLFTEKKRKRKTLIDPNCDIYELYEIADKIIGSKFYYLDENDKHDVRQEIIKRFYEISEVKGDNRFSFLFCVGFRVAKAYLTKYLNFKKYLKTGLFNPTFYDTYYIFYRCLNGEVIWSGISFTKKFEWEVT